jgi:urease subunit beta
MTDGITPGEVVTADDTVRLNAGRETTTLTVANTGDRPVQVGSHFHFAEVNAALTFDREAAVGKRLNIAAGTAVRFEPGDQTTVELVAIGGRGHIQGMNGLVNGRPDDPETLLGRAREDGFLRDRDGDTE